jgi:hypothetical protein
MSCLWLHSPNGYKWIVETSNVQTTVSWSECLPSTFWSNTIFCSIISSAIFTGDIQRHLWPCETQKKGSLANTKASQEEIWSSHSSVASDKGLLGWQCVTGVVVPDIWSTFLFECLRLKRKALQSFKTTCPLTFTSQKTQISKISSAIKNITVLWNVCHSHVDRYLYFWVIYCLHLQGRTDSQTDDGGSMFCQKYGTYLWNIAFQPSFTICSVIGWATICSTTIQIDTSAILQCCFNYKIYLTTNMTGTGHEYHAHIQ